MNTAISIGASSISVYHEGEFHSLESSHKNYEKVKELLRQPPESRDMEEILRLMDVIRTVRSVTTQGRVEIRDHDVLFKGEPIGGYMVERLVAMVYDEIPLEPWARFMDNLMDNPNPEVREDLYKWMEKGQLPITDDGMIIGFKKVTENFRDVHTGTFDNSPGSVLEMPRDKCDPSRNNTCSTGFHFCSADYLANFSGSKVVVVNINPRDVTAIPKDYKLTKARCCKYRVVAELSSESAARHKVWKEKHVVNFEDPRELPDDLLKPRVGSTGKKPKEVKPEKGRTEGPAPRDPLAGSEVVEVPCAPPSKSGGKEKKPVAKKTPAKTVGKKTGVKTSESTAKPSTAKAKKTAAKKEPTATKTAAKTPRATRGAAPSSGKTSASKTSPAKKAAKAVTAAVAKVAESVTPKPKRSRKKS